MKRALVSLAAMAMVAGTLAGPAGARTRAERPGRAEPADFPYGVGVNDVTSTTARLWTQTPDPTITAQIGRDPTFATNTISVPLRVPPQHDGTVQVPVTRLRSATTYYYRFLAGDGSSGVSSRTGQFTTAPDPAADVGVTFAYSGDQDGTLDAQGAPCYNRFESFGAVQSDQPQFYMNLGDTIYADSPCLATPDTSLADYRNSYKQSFGYDTLRNLRAAAPFYTIWDDHEVRNDFDRQTVDPTLYANGLRAFVEYDNMSRQRPGLGFYRRFSWGKNVDIFILDERTFRTEEANKLDANGDGVEDCQNPQTAQPDFAPNLDQSTRNLIASLVPNTGLDIPPPPQCLKDLNAPARTILGATQRKRFEADLLASTARWKFVFTEDQIQQFYALPYDRFEGYLWERNQILRFVDTNAIKNVVWLATDIHAAMAHTVDYNNRTPGTYGGVQGMVEYSVGPIATDTLAAEIDTLLGTGSSGLFRSLLVTANKNTCAAINVDGYGLVTVDPGTLELSIYPRDPRGNAIAGNGAPGGYYADCYDYHATPAG